MSLKTTVLSSLVLILLIASGIGAWYYYDSTDTSTTPTTTTPTTTTQQTHWTCYDTTGTSIGTGVDINWGYAAQDGAWACNQWVKECSGGCTAK